jgi:hypothetical protein
MTTVLSQLRNRPGHNALLAADGNDPLPGAPAPPHNEKPTERKARLAAEYQAKLRSDAIDEEIERERIAQWNLIKPIKILLLGAHPARGRAERC